MADGSIIIDTRIDTGGVSKGMNAVKAGMTRISAQVSKMGDSAKSSFQRQITAITGLYQNYEKQERKVSELKSKLEELSKVKIETEEYKKLKDDIKALEDEFEKVETKQREWLDMGFSIDSAPLKELDKQIWTVSGQILTGYSGNRKRCRQLEGPMWILHQQMRIRVQPRSIIRSRRSWNV